MWANVGERRLVSIASAVDLQYIMRFKSELSHIYLSDCLFKCISYKVIKQCPGLLSVPLFFEVVLTVLYIHMYMYTHVHMHVGCFK